MKNISYIFLILCFIFFKITIASEILSGKTSLSGKVTDKTTGEPLPGVNIYLPDIKTGTISDVNGLYKMNNLPQTKLLLQVSLLGYKTVIETIDLNSTTTRDFSLEPAVKEMNEVVVTGLSQAAERHRTPVPITIISKKEFLQNSNTNIIDALAKQPGISAISTGPGISKPVIRGLGYNRVVVVNDGIRQEGQQWGDEHGIEIDEFSVNRVEILKGPASLSYGSDAIGGVINMFSPPAPPEGTIGGSLISNYQTNNGLIAYSGNMTGNENGYIWDIRYSGKHAHAYKNKYDGYVHGSALKENNINTIIGLNRAWGYSHVHLGTFHLIPGIVEGERDSATGKFIRGFALNDSLITDTIVSDAELKSYIIGIPRQEIRHFRAVLNNSILIRNNRLNMIIGFQQNHRKEFGDVLDPENYGLYFLLNTLNYDLRYILAEKNNFQLSFGGNGMYQTSKNKGAEFLIPEYTLFDAGAFITARKSYEKADISGGLRYDMRSQEGKDLYLNANEERASASDTSAMHRFTGFNMIVSGFSGSLGMSYLFSENLYSKINVSKGFRAPNIGELGSNGEHEGTNRYEIGDPQLKAESSIQFDIAFGVNSHHISAEINLFNNTIDNFVYLSKLNGPNGGDSLIDGSSAFKFRQDNARLRGGEIILDIHPHPLDWLHFENSFSIVEAIQKNASDSTRYLPFTPAPRFQSELKADIKKIGKILSNAYVKLNIENYLKQNKIYSAYGTETITPAYTLVNIGLGTEVNSHNKQLFSIFISMNNTADIEYQSHLSRLKYAEVNNASGKTGVYNMGRNISFRLLIPINVKKTAII